MIRTMKRTTCTRTISNHVESHISLNYVPNSIFRSLAHRIAQLPINQRTARIISSTIEWCRFDRLARQLYFRLGRLTDAIGIEWPPEFDPKRQRD